jgi:hypothetical protein
MRKKRSYSLVNHVLRESLKKAAQKLPRTVTWLRASPRDIAHMTPP